MAKVAIAAGKQKDSSMYEDNFINRVIERVNRLDEQHIVIFTDGSFLSFELECDGHYVALKRYDNGGKYVGSDRVPVNMAA